MDYVNCHPGKIIPYFTNPNVGGCKKLTDISALEDKKNIIRLRIGDCAVTDEQINAVKAALPNIAAHEERMERIKNEHKGIPSDL
jgi:hypothetical protein